jgi:hypothetical protein
MSSDDPNLKLLSGCVLWALEDETWQDLGFRRRPKRGSFFVPFVPRWKIDLEHLIYRELTFLSLSSQILIRKLSQSDIDSLSIYYGSNTLTPTLYETFGYDGDRLDLTRLGRKPNPQYMSTECAKEICRKQEWKRLKSLSEGCGTVATLPV